MDSIRAALAAVSQERIRASVFALAKDPFPFRKLNFTVPGHEKCTLHEVDDWLEERLRGWGYRVSREAVSVQAFSCDRTRPLHHWYAPPAPDAPFFTAYNLYVERAGTTMPDEIVLLCAHKDSQSWIDSPGANDNAVGTASLLELARVLAGIETQRTVRILFCNEEHAPWTSVTAAEKAKARGENLVAIFNLDGIGVQSDEDRAAGKRGCVVGYTRPEGRALAERIAQANDRFGIGLEVRAAPRERPGDDDGSFVNAGYPAAVIVIGSFPYGDPQYHLEGDIPERVDCENAARGARAVLATLLTR